MTSLTRLNPFDETLDDLFRGFFVKPISLDNERPLQMRMDVKENGSAYVVHAEIPGVRKEDIQISIDGNQVGISAEVKGQSEEKQGERVLRSERYYGKVQRNFSLASEVDAATAQARYTDGVLELTLPKKAATSARRITIQ